MKVLLELQFQINLHSDLCCSEVCNNIFSRSVPRLCQDKKLIKINKENTIFVSLILLVVGCLCQAWRPFFSADVVDCRRWKLKNSDMFYVKKIYLESNSRTLSWPFHTLWWLIKLIVWPYAAQSVSVLIWLCTNIIKHKWQTDTLHIQNKQDKLRTQQWFLYVLNNIW